ncbi:MAG: hypothetical protein KJO07_21475, partial [Deltaproteobacteria bacterium]|nr:hypothetical protein [Deltaproteobacteria bacterium]
MRVALAILLLLHGSSALAQADAGPVTDAAAVDPRTKVDSALRAEIESLQSDREAVDASGLEDFDSEIVRRRHGVELRSPGAALALLATLEARLPELQQRADDRDALYQLAAEADKRKPKRRRTALDAARLATMALEAQLSRAQLEMTRATIAYLSSTQAARRTASETAEARLRAAQRELAEKREAARRAEEQARAEAASAITAAEKLL